MKKKNNLLQNQVLNIYLQHTVNLINESNIIYHNKILKLSKMCTVVYLQMVQPITPSQNNPKNISQCPHQLEKKKEEKIKKGQFNALDSCKYLTCSADEVPHPFYIQRCQ